MFRILIVEDSRSYRESLRDVLDSTFSRAVIEEAVNGKEALEKAGSFCPNLVFMDIRLPDESGLELTKKMKARYPQISVVMLSGHDAPEYREAAIRCGASDFLVKGTASKDDVQALVRSLRRDEETRC
jgi:YesN/AraC family two-component response regulator